MSELITKTVKDKILSIVSVFETGRPSPFYHALVILPDGPGGSRQITYGKHQTTENSGLGELVRDYAAAGGAYSKSLGQYAHLIGKTPLHTNKPFIELLKAAGRDRIMWDVQDRFFERRYFNPAFRFFKVEGFTLPLSLLVIYDSYIHSGGIPSYLRDDFKEVPPTKGGEERKWIDSYVNARDYWLEHHSRPILRNTDYRTDCFKEQIVTCNWWLTAPVVCKFNQREPSRFVIVP